MTPRRQARQRLVIAVMVLMTLASSGCWDFRQVDERAFVLMLGVDKGTNGQGYHVTTQKIIGQYLAGAQAGGGGGGGGGGQQRRPWIIREADGANVPQALELIRSKIHRDQEFGHLKVFVLGEEVARQDISQIDTLTRDIKIPSTVFVAVAHGQARDVVSAPNPAEDVPALYVFHGYTGRYARTLAILPVPLWYVVNRTVPNPLVDPLAGGLAVENGEVSFAGAAVWNGHEMAGWLDPSETRLVTFLKKFKQVDDFTVTADVPGTALRVASARGRYWADWDPDGTVVLHLKVSLGGDLASSSRPVITREDESLVEAQVAESFRSRLVALVQHLKAMGSDPLGFGERLREVDASAPEIATGPAWKAAYARARIDADVQVRINIRGYSR